MQGGNGRWSRCDQSIALRRAPERPRNFVRCAKRADEDPDRVRCRNFTEASEGRKSQRRGAVRHEWRDRVYGIGRSHATERGDCVATDIRHLVTQREHERRGGSPVAKITEASRDGLPYFGRRVLRLADERDDGTCVAEAGERGDDSNAHRWGWIVESTEERRDRVGGHLVTKSLRRFGTYVRVRVAERAGKGCHSARARQGSSYLARLAPQARVGRVEPTNHRVRRSRGSESHRRVSRRKADFVVGIVERSES
jgi:hypothetical protein